MAELNSFRSFVEDEMGQRFLFTTGTNRPDLVASTKEHATWWRGYVKRKSEQGSYNGRAGRPLNAPIGKTRFVIEFYDDASAR